MQTRFLADDISLVFVHGIRGHALHTWTATATPVKQRRTSRLRLFKTKPSKASDNGLLDSQSTFWPRDLLGPDLSETRICTYGYDANVAAFLSRTADNSIYGVARNLVVRLEALRENTNTVRPRENLETRLVNYDLE